MGTLPNHSVATLLSKGQSAKEVCNDFQVIHIWQQLSLFLELRLPHFQHVQKQINDASVVLARLQQSSDQMDFVIYDLGYEVSERHH